MSNISNNFNLISMKLIRNIHNIGQGAFYTEKFYNDENNNIANIIYDCGCERNIPLRAKELIKKSFKLEKKDTIDILFISHFDADHVNGILTLKESVNKISYVIIPELSEEEKIILSAISKIRKEDKYIQSLITDPESFFNPNHDEGTKIIYISKADENTNNDNEGITDLESLSNKEKIPSGSPIKYKNINWLYIPINCPTAEETIIEFKELLDDNGLTIESLKNIKKGIVSKFKKCYEKVFKDVNTYSLVLYSGPYDINQYRRLSSCLYTGDVNLNKRNILNELNIIPPKHINNIGLIQVPHHGSLESYNPDILYKINNDCRIFFLSYGIYNTYGHPSSLIIEDMILNHKLIICVDECIPFILSYTNIY